MEWYELDSQKMRLALHFAWFTLTTPRVWWFCLRHPIVAWNVFLLGVHLGKLEKEILLEKDSSVSSA